MDTYNANIRVRDLPVEVNVILEGLRSARKKDKWEIIREALIEYAERHKGEVNMALKAVG